MLLVVSVLNASNDMRLTASSGEADRLLLLYLALARLISGIHLNFICRA